MQLIYSILNFIIGLLVGMFVSAQIVLPIIYALPKSIIRVFKGELKMRIIIIHFISPIIWIISIYFLYFIAKLILPGVFNLITNPNFLSGIIWGFFWILWGLISKTSRVDLKKDYNDFIIKYQK